jgi:predicted DNA-binding transcriptional regulator AlpA
VSRCRCGFDFRDTTSQLAEEYELRISSYVHYLCGLGNSIAAKGAEGSPLFSLDLKHFATALFFMSGQQRGFLSIMGKNSAASMRNGELHANLIGALETFDDWPKKFYEFLDRRRRQNSGVNYATSIGRDFGILHKGLRHLASSDKLRFMWIAYEDYIFTRWDGALVPPPMLDEAKRNRRKYVSRNAARELLGTDQAWIDRLCETGQLKSIVKPRGKARCILIERESLEALRRTYDNYLTTNESARLLDICPNAVLDLVDHQCLKPVRGREIDNYLIRKFSRESIEDLLKGISSRVVQSGTNSTLKTISWKVALQLLKRCGFGTGRFVRGILDGEIDPCGESSKTGFSRFLFAEPVVLNYLRTQLCTVKGTCLYVTEAAKLLGLNSQGTYFLAKKGFLITKTTLGDRTHLLVTQESIKSFNAMYTPVAKLARMHKVGCYYFVKLLLSTGILPVSGPTVDGGIQYIFRREDLQKINVEELLASAKPKSHSICRPKNHHRSLIGIAEVADILGVSRSIVRKLIENGVLFPNRHHVRGRNSRVKYLFNRFIVEKLSQESITLSDLILISVAAGMMGIPSSSFNRRWVQRGHFKIVELKSVPSRRYVLRRELETLIATLKIKAQELKGLLTSRKAAAALGVNMSTIYKWERAGKLPRTYTCTDNGLPAPLFSPDDVLKLRCQRDDATSSTRSASLPSLT